MTAAELLGTMAAFVLAAVAALILARIARSIADDAQPRSDRPLWSAALHRERYAWAYAELERCRRMATIGRPPAGWELAA